MLPRLILASASEGRRDLLAKAGYQFEVLPSGVDEPPFEGFPGPRAYVQYLAWLKAEAVSSHINDGVIIAADSIAWLDKRVIGKPLDRDDARRIINWLSGTSHQLWTGVCLWERPTDRQLCWQEHSLVAMRRLIPAEVEEYLETGIWQGKSGAYAIQEHDDPYVRVLEGSISNVVGLPVESLSAALQVFSR
jgi:septum formation protein